MSIAKNMRPVVAEGARESYLLSVAKLQSGELPRIRLKEKFLRKKATRAVCHRFSASFKASHGPRSI